MKRITILQLFYFDFSILYLEVLNMKENNILLYCMQKKKTEKKIEER